VNLSYSIVLDPAEEGGYTVRVPRLPGCVTEGDTLDEALANAREAIMVYLLSLRDDGEAFPPPDAGGIMLRAVEIDLDAA
jgi:antitoxin HicB